MNDSPRDLPVLRSLILAFLAGLTGVVLHLPGLLSALVADDLAQWAALTGKLPVERSPLDAYTVVRHGELPALAARGVLPWWSQLDVHAVGFRPLGSLLLWLDHVLGLSAGGQHLHSVLWWFALVAGFSLLAHAMTSERVAVLAVIFFALSPAHSIPLSWVANRVALVSAVGAVFALLGLVRWREQGSPRALGLFVAGVAVSIAASEYGLGVLAFWLAYELSRGLRPTLRAVLGCVALVLGYLALRTLFGAAVVGSVMYTDPISSPLVFLRHAWTRFPALVVDLALHVPSELTGLALSRAAAPIRWLAFLLALVPLGAGLLLLRRRARAWLLVGALGALVPLLSVEPNARLLSLPTIGSAMVLALAVDALLRRGAGLLRRVPARALALAVCLVHAPLAAVLAVTSSLAWSVTAGLAQRRMAGSWRDDGASCYVVINAPDIVGVYSAPMMLAKERGRLPGCWWVLASSTEPVSVRRVSDSSLEVSSERGLLSSPVIQFVRDPRTPAGRLARGDVRELGRLRLQVLADRDGEPTRVRFDLPRSVAQLTLLASGPDGFVRVEPPAVGEAREF